MNIDKLQYFSKRKPSYELHTDLHFTTFLLNHITDQQTQIQYNLD